VKKFRVSDPEANLLRRPALSEVYRCKKGDDCGLLTGHKGEHIPKKTLEELAKEK